MIYRLESETESSGGGNDNVSPNVTATAKPKKDKGDITALLAEIQSLQSTIDEMNNRDIRIDAQIVTMSGVIEEILTKLKRINSLLILIDMK